MRNLFLFPFYLFLYLPNLIQCNDLPDSNSPHHESNSDAIDDDELELQFGDLATYRILQHFEQNASKVFYNNRQIPCYQWLCTSTYPYAHGNICEYCLPHVIVAGFNKCGTTAFDFMMNQHPNITMYAHKEVNIFEQFSSRHDITNLASFEERTTAWLTYEMSLSIKQTTLWLDGSNSIVWQPKSYLFIKRFSPLTKIIFLVRDPYQSLASFYSMNYRFDIQQMNITTKNSIQYRNFIESKMLPDFEKSNMGSKTCLENVENSRKLKRSDPMYECLIDAIQTPYFYFIPELLLSWKQHYDHENMILIDHYELLNHPEKVVNIVEDFLQLPKTIFSSTSSSSSSVKIVALQYNVFGNWSPAEISSSNSTAVNGVGEKHRHPKWKSRGHQLGYHVHGNRNHFHYSHDMLKKLVSLYSSSLDFFEEMFGWKIVLEANYSDHLITSRFRKSHHVTIVNTLGLRDNHPNNGKLRGSAGKYPPDVQINQARRQQNSRMRTN